MKNSKEVVKYVNALALKKEGYKRSKVFVLAVVAGAMVSIACVFAATVSGTVENEGIRKLIFGASFPVALIMICLAGTELFTGNTSYFVPNVLNGKQKIGAVLKNWFWVYSGNLVGSLLFAYFLVYLPHLTHDNYVGEMLIDIAVGKTSHTFGVSFLKGIAANWMVCTAIWMMFAAEDTIGKIVAMWFPIFVFAAIGYEHSIANLFIVPIAMMEGADITVWQFLHTNLIPVTLGNIVGGFVCVGAMYWFTSGREEKN